MALQPLFSLTPLSPRAYTYDAAAPDAAYGRGYSYGFGGFTGAAFPSRLADQHDSELIIVAHDPVDLADQTIGSMINDVYRRCVFNIVFAGFNVSTENQYLLLFALRGIFGDPSAQFFVGTDHVRTEAVSGDEQVAIVMDTPGEGVYAYIYVRLASPNPSSAMGFIGMDCYLL